MAALDEVVTVLSTHRFRFQTEDDLQAAITAALKEYGLDALREVVLGARDRIDILVGGVGIEVKIDGTTADARRQLKRYAVHDAIEALVLVSSRMRHSLLTTDEIDGKPFCLVSVSRGLG